METKEALDRIVDRLASGWGLITVGEGDDFNMMTIAWGQAGNLWWKPVVTVYAHPSRYTYGFLERNDYFVISLFPPEYKKDLQVLGTKSRRYGDKLCTPSSSARSSMRSRTSGYRACAASSRESLATSESISSSDMPAL